MTTPHISASPGDFAPAVLFPGDPRRARKIAQQLMPDARLISDVRSMEAYTGTYRGIPLSVMGSGMGMPSATIYATELFEVFDVQRIIRVGTCGGIHPDVNIGDTVIAMGAHTTSAMNSQRIPHVHFSAVASWQLLHAAAHAASNRADNTTVHIGTVLSEDHFYFKPEGLLERLQNYGTLAVEMEAAALYGVAAEYQRDALAVLTVSDTVLQDGPNMTPEQRESRFQDALRLALTAALHNSDLPEAELP
ncbi:MAG: purine-nucleoside phosphorylase [Actinomycetaceae bacterium]|nr:purine-nucleoside phosphorylase [Actinomycetaceae bacterium]